MVPLVLAGVLDVLVSLPEEIDEALLTLPTHRVEVTAALLAQSRQALFAVLPDAAIHAFVSPASNLLNSDDSLLFEVCLDVSLHNLFIILPCGAAVVVLLVVVASLGAKKILESLLLFLKCRGVRCVDWHVHLIFVVVGKLVLLFAELRLRLILNCIQIDNAMILLEHAGCVILLEIDDWLLLQLARVTGTRVQHALLV